MFFFLSERVESLTIRIHLGLNVGVHEKPILSCLYSFKASSINVHEKHVLTLSNASMTCQCPHEVYLGFVPL